MYFGSLSVTVDLNCTVLFCNCDIFLIDKIYNLKKMAPKILLCIGVDIVLMYENRKHVPTQVRQYKKDISE